MGFLTLPSSGIDMSKVVVSFWFRIPQATLDKVSMLPGNVPGYGAPNTWSVLQKILTFLSWGDQPQGTLYGMKYQQIGAYYPQPGLGDPIPNYNTLPTLPQTGSMPPCYIGIDCSDNQPSFAVNLQTATAPTMTGINYMTSDNTYWIGDASSGYHKEEIIYTDMSYTEAYPATIGGNAFSQTSVSIRSDQWHHVLISWDINGSETGSPGPMLTYPPEPPPYNPLDYITSSFKMYFAFDDRNYSGPDLPATWLGAADNTGTGDGVDSNIVITDDDIIKVAGSSGTNAVDTLTFTQSKINSGSYDLSLGSLPASNLYIPGWTGYTDDASTINSVYHIEMAELQIFTEVTLDTRSISNRRAFIDDNGKPVNPATASKMLGKSPEILLHRSNNWIKGKNTGSEVSFLPTGTIKQYKPDPSLHGPQS